MHIRLFTKAITIFLTTVVAVVNAQSQNLSPVFMYYMNKDNMQVVYWDSLEKYEGGSWSWDLQDTFRKNARRYTKMLLDDNKIAEVRYDREVLKAADGTDADFGLRNEWYAMKGIRYTLVNPNAVHDTEYSNTSFHLLMTPDYMTSHKLLPIQYVESEEGETPMPAFILRQLQAKFGEVERSQKVAVIDNRYTYGVVQFKPKGNKVVALEVLAVDGKAYYEVEEADYDAQEPYSIWNVDDDGNYGPANILAAFEGNDGPEVYFVRWAPESATPGCMSLAGGRLQRNTLPGYYVYPENPKPEGIEN